MRPDQWDIMLSSEEGIRGTPTQFLEEEILEITEPTWQAMLGLDIYPRTVPASMGLVDGYFTGKVEISGAWTGAELLHGSRHIGPSCSRGVFSHEADGVSEQDFLDAKYELTIIMDGSIASLLPEPWQLSLVTVEAKTKEHFQILGMERMSELVFDCQDQPLFVSVWQCQAV